LLTGSEGDDPIHEDAAGGRIALLVGNEGILMVDSQYAPLTPSVLAAVRKISNQPIRVLVNTHVHLDHTGGNAAIASTGALVFAREETREAMFLPLPAIAGNTAPPNDPRRLPLVTYGASAEIKLRMDGETIDLIAVPPAHTAGDTLVRFEQADTFMVGDFYRSYGYPFGTPREAAR
jgi:cyclase